MANETKNKAGEKKSNLTPFIIIGIIFAVTVGIIWAIINSGDTGEETSARNTATTTGNTGNAPEQPLPNYGTAPPGAVPPHFKGSENAAVVVEEFADFQCPTCAVVHPRMNEITSKFGSKIKFVFRNYPLTTIHRNAFDASLAAEAAALQGKFWEMQNQLFQNQAQWSTAAQPRILFDEYAKRIGLDVDRFKGDMLGFGTKGRVDEDMRRARALNLTGTPTIIVNGKVVNSMETSVIAQAIEAELAKFEKASEEASGSEQTSNAEGEEKE